MSEVVRKINALQLATTAGRLCVLFLVYIVSACIVCASAQEIDARPSESSQVHPSAGEVVRYNGTVLVIRDEVLGRQQSYVLAKHVTLDGKPFCGPSVASPSPTASGRVHNPSFVEGWDSTGRYDWSSCVYPQKALQVGHNVTLVYWTRANGGATQRLTDELWLQKI